MKKSKGSTQKAKCCDKADRSAPADQTAQLNRLRRIKGQLVGVERMIEEGRYCPEIIIQVQAIRSAMSSLESNLLGEHLRSCVKEAFRSQNEREKDLKIEEILNLVRKA